jgi:7,8-dihydroneopterin aldolase/epimerase/oxygenase
MEATSHSDRITLKNMVFYGSHGVSPAERELGQRFEIDLTLYVNLRPAAAVDKLSATLNYGDVYKVVEQVATERVFNLLETLAQVIAKEVLCLFPTERVEVVVRKPRAPIRGTIDHVEVVVARNRDELDDL